MTPEEEIALREEIKAVKAANAFLYLALEAAGHLAFAMPKGITAAMMNAQDRSAIEEEIRKQSAILSENMAKAHQCIWDEDGKPR